MKNFFQKTLMMALAVLTVATSFAQSKKYEATWESLNSRECPAWYRDAKFGIFIHWGLYSVPGFADKGKYAEWYWKNRTDDMARPGETLQEEFHNKTYGPNFGYPEFRHMFKAELFNPTEWANIFERSGAKYVVLTSKHHDGYCLWDSKEASESFGMTWNSVESGPHRDLVGDLTEAVRKTDVKMGLYYSIWDWFNPYWNADMQKCVSGGNMDVDFTKAGAKKGKFTKEQVDASKAGLSKYIHKVMYPQFKQLVNDYQPALIFSDGDWWMNDELWESKPLLSWLFNNAPNKDEVVINDRWGQGRGKQGDYYTTEYGSGFEGIDKPWEENRGIGKSFGVNRYESYDDYHTDKELIYMLVDLVSRGGNLLLNIGPNPDGTIPVIMQERLLHIGDWLDVNGDAIYGTRVYKNNFQWSKKGQIPVFKKGEYKTGFPIFEQTIDPKPGNAVKEMWFTKKGSKLYALTPGWPKGDKLEIRDISVKGAKVRLLGSDKKLPFKVKGSTLTIDLSGISTNDLPCNYIYSFEIDGLTE